MRNLFFWARIAFFAAFALLPAVHPAVLRPFDSSSIWLFFALVPSVCALAFYGPSLPRIGRFPFALPALAFLALATFAVNGVSSACLSTLAWAFAAYALTFLSFRKGWYRLLYLEPLAFLYLAWRLTEFSRSSALMAEDSRFAILVILSACLTVWSAYSAMICLLEYSRAPGGMAKRTAFPVLFAAAVIALFAVALWSGSEKITDYVQKINSADKRIPPKNGRGDNKGHPRAVNGQSGDKPGKLVEASDELWRNNPGSGSGDGNQRMIMVVESPVESLYLAGDYLGVLDPVKGFVSDPLYFANTLALTPYLETWKNPDTGVDAYRIPVWIEVYSAIPDKMTSWLPLQIEPTVLDAKNYPLRYSYRALSLVSEAGLTGKFPYIPPLEGDELREMKPYLDVPVPEKDLAPFRQYESTLLSGGETLDAKITKILKSFANCRYEIGGEDDASIGALKTFLFERRTGDCTEFSNTAALIGRLAGIPSRVVTGYAVRRELQTKAHRDGILRIIEKFPPLAGKNPDHLFLVTTAHAHSWPEFYIPGQGWVDFESTQYAQPPTAGGDPNSGDVVIPDFDSIGGKAPPKFAFPWRLLLKLAVAGFAVAALALWLRRMILLACLAFLARRPDERGAKARFRLFVARLPSRGFRPKRRDETPREYGIAIPELGSVMKNYELAVFHPDGDIRLQARQRLDACARGFLGETRTVLSVLREISGLDGGGIL